MLQDPHPNLQTLQILAKERKLINIANDFMENKMNSSKGYSGCLQFPTTTSNAIINIFIQIPIWTNILTPIPICGFFSTYTTKQLSDPKRGPTAQLNSDTSTYQPGESFKSHRLRTHSVSQDCFHPSSPQTPVTNLSCHLCF